MPLLTRRALPVSLLVALAMVLMTFVSVASAAPGTSSSSSARGAADHTAECNVTFDAEGNVLVDGEAPRCSTRS